MLKAPILRERIVSELRRCHDSQRLVQKLALGRGEPDDLLALASTISATEDLVYIVRKWADEYVDPLLSGPEVDCLTTMISRIHLEGPNTLAQRINDAVDQEGLVLQRRIEESETREVVEFAQSIACSEGLREDAAAGRKSSRKKRPSSLKEHYLDTRDAWIMTPTASEALRRLHDELEQLVQRKSTLEEDLRDRLGAPSLTLRWTPGLRYICHVKGKMTQNIEELRSVSSSKSTRSFHHPEWSKLGQTLDQVKLRIHAEEQDVFRTLRQQVIVNLIKLRSNATVLDELDIACSFALLAKEQGLVRPILNMTTTHKIIGGRHPTVQGSLQEQGRTFVTNDCFVGDKEKVWLITGPNMAGKSTYLRQNALITIMAQVGSYVPAEYAEIGIVDQIFSRVGSADNLYRDQSTFMVEMLETAAILKDATPKSFVIMDEIGRGTTPEDGVAIAFASLNHLYHINQCRTLFATHFHKVADLSKDMAGVAYYCTDIAEDKQGGFHYLHKLRNGVNRESHALKVARLAGLPEVAIKVAQDVINTRRKTCV
jgi:DNA mismatch repair ATPase MutS